MTCDVLFLTSTYSDIMHEAAVQTIRSLYDSEADGTFTVWNVENNIDLHEVPDLYCEEDDTMTNYCHAVLFPNTQFHFNFYISVGLKHTIKKQRDPAHYILILNEFYIFDKGWFTELIGNIKAYDLDCASPVDISHTPSWEGGDKTFTGKLDAVHYNPHCCLFRRSSFDVLCLDTKCKEMAGVSLRSEMVIHQFEHGVVGLSRINKIKL